MSDQNQNSHSAGSPQTNSGQAGQAGFTPLPDEKNTHSGGAPLAKIQTKQIAIMRKDIEKFGIAEDFVKKNPALIDLILKTESMKDEERKYWFQLLPIMNKEQIKKLQNILQNEKDQLFELDQKYETEVAKLNEKQSNWNPKKFIEKRKRIEKNERAHEANEKDAEEDILKQLKNM
ncbi:hypothetical protein KAI54_04065 [Candidatus Gracilibacteria bacterium]|nr:hypothetical protein [Candidatus Gracilibacteria bacterium]